MAAALRWLMDRNRKPPRRVGGETHLCRTDGLDPPLDVVSVKMQDRRLICAPSQLDGVALLHADQPLVGVHTAFFDSQLEHNFVRARIDGEEFHRECKHYRKKTSGG